MRIRRVVLGIIVGLAALSGCAPDFDTHYSTAYLELSTDFDEPLCEGDLQRWDALVEHLEDQLAVELQPGLELYMWDIALPDDSPCHSSAAGCYSGAQHRIWTTVQAVEHELVHAVAESLGSNEPLFDEGLAGALQSEPTRFGSTTPSSNLGLRSHEVARVTAAHFVRWLWETEGPERVRELIRSRGRADDFERIFGYSLAEADQRYFEEAPWSYPPMFVWEVPSLPEVDEQRWEEDIEFDCGDPSAYGRAGGMAMSRTLMIGERGHYAIWTSADGISMSQRQREIVVSSDEALVQLAGDVPAEYTLWIPGRKLVIYDLVPGEYELWVTDFDSDLERAEIAVWRHLGPIPTLPESAQ